MTLLTALGVFGIVFGVFYSAKLYFKLSVGWCRSQTCLVGKTAIITGANTGIGYETALDLAKRGAKVIIACRNREKAESARAKIIETTGNAQIYVKILDLSSLNSVRNFASDILQSEPRLDILVNNAGIGGVGSHLTQDGFQLLTQVNYLSGFLLTYLLVDLLKKSRPSRVVNVSSLTAKYRRNFELEHLEKFTGLYYIYANSKLCNILFTRELAKRLKNEGVTAYSLHPGAVKTDIFRRLQGNYILHFLYNFFKTSEEGAQTTIYTSVAKGIEGDSGEHFSDCEKVAPYRSVIKDPTLPERLWNRTVQLLDLKSTEF